MFFGRTIKLFYFKGIPVEITLVGLLLMGLLILSSIGLAAGANQSGLIMAAGITFGLFASILVHEMAHALSGMALGATVVGIRLDILGGATYFAAKPPTYFKDILVSLAGPASNLVLWKLFDLSAHLLSATDSTTISLSMVLLTLSHFNLFLGLFNALPCYPLDGGQATYMMARWVTAHDKFAAGLTMVTSLGLVGFILFGQLGLLGNLSELLPIGGIFTLYLCVWIVLSSLGLYNSAMSIVRFRPTPRQQAEKQRAEAERKAKTQKGYATFDQGKALLLEKDYAGALALFNAAIEQEPKNNEYLDYRAYTYLQAGQFEQALNDYNQLVERLPKRADYYASRAQVQRQLGYITEARNSVAQSLTLNPLDSQARQLSEELARLG